MKFLSSSASSVRQFQTVKTVPGSKTCYSCGFCGKYCVSPSALDIHLLIHTGEKPFTCSICNKAFRRKAHLQRHQSTHIREMPFICLVCGIAFDKRDVYEEHMLSHKS